MSKLFGGGVKMPEPPKVIRAPVEGDEAARNAAKRFQSQARKRKGREASILTSQLRETVGSSGQTLGA